MYAQMHLVFKELKAPTLYLVQKNHLEERAWWGGYFSFNIVQWQLCILQQYSFVSMYRYGHMLYCEHMKITFETLITPY